MKTKEFELYIHIPFCVRKCNYCDFCSFPAGETKIESYMEQLCREIRSWKEKMKHQRLATVFIGGGTPSILQEAWILRMMEAVWDTFQQTEGIEVTIEANPGTVTRGKLHAYRQAGINRISFGLQSMQKKELEYLGRIHDRKDFLESFENARQEGFQNINVDLMSGIPLQTLSSYERTLRETAQLEPEHISAYSLIVEEGTAFARDPKLEQLLPSEGDDVKMYEMTGEILADYGYHKYEISNYAKKGMECRHNLGYWSQVPYLGVGLFASSYLDGKRFCQTRSMDEYLGQKDFQKEYHMTERQTEQEAMEEFMFLGLRKTKGVSEMDFQERFGNSLDSIYGNVIQEAVQNGFLKREKENIALTEQGILFSNQVLSDFLL